MNYFLLGGYIILEENMDKMIDYLLAFFPLFYMELVNPKELRERLPRNYMVILNSKYYENKPISVMADNLSISRSHMTSHIDQLVDDGLLRKVPDEKDRRIIRVVTTLEGRRVRDKYRKIFDDNIEEKLSLLSPIELEEFYKSVETIKNVALKFINTKKL